MAIDTSIFQNVRPVQMPSYAEAQQRAASLTNMGLQQQALRQQMENQSMQMQRAQKDQDYQDAQRRIHAIGSTAVDLATMPEDRAKAEYPKRIASLVNLGVISPESVPPSFDPNFVKSVAGEYLNSPEYLNLKLVQSEIEKSKAQAAKASREAMNPVASLSPGEKKADQAFGKDAAEYYYSGGKATVEKNLGRLQDAIEQLKKNPDLVGGITTRFPILASDMAQDTINPKMAAVRDEVRGAIQASLRQVLGSQFTEKEGEAIFNRAFNPRLSAEENIRRIQTEADAIKRMASDKDRAMNQFRVAGTLRGFRPGATDLEAGGADTEYARGQNDGGVGIGPRSAYASPPPIKPGTVENGYVYMGGDPGDQKNWKRAK